MLRILINDIFDDDVAKVVERDDGSLYGFIMVDGTKKVFKQYSNGKHDMYINERTMNRIARIYNRGNDTRVNNLYDYILDDFDTIDDRIYYCIQYTDDDLLK